MASPPYTFALAPTTAKPFSVKSTRPFASASSGLPAPMRTSLPVSATLPLTPVASTLFSGIVRLSFRSAAPVAVLGSSALSIQPLIGVVLTKRSISASGPRPVPSSVSTGSVSRLRIATCTFGNSTPPICVLPLRNSSVPWSSSRSTWVLASAGHGEV